MKDVQNLNMIYDFSADFEFNNISRNKLADFSQKNQREITALPLRLTLTVEEAAETLGVSRAFAYEAVRRGEIPSIRIGRRILIPKVGLERLLGS